MARFVGGIERGGVEAGVETPVVGGDLEFEGWYLPIGFRRGSGIMGDIWPRRVGVKTM